MSTKAAANSAKASVPKPSPKNGSTSQLNSPQARNYNSNNKRGRQPSVDKDKDSSAQKTSDKDLLKDKDNQQTISQTKSLSTNNGHNNQQQTDQQNEKLKVTPPLSPSSTRGRGGPPAKSQKKESTQTASKASQKKAQSISSNLKEKDQNTVATEPSSSSSVPKITVTRSQSVSNEKTDQQDRARSRSAGSNLTKAGLQKTTSPTNTNSNKVDKMLNVESDSKSLNLKNNQSNQKLSISGVKSGSGSRPGSNEKNLNTSNISLKPPNSVDSNFNDPSQDQSQQFQSDLSQQFLNSPSNRTNQGTQSRSRSRSPRRSNQPGYELRVSTTGCNSGPMHMMTGMWSLKGKRDANEDAHICMLDYITEDFPNLDLRATKASPCALYGIFDGHGGDHCARFIAKQLPEKLKYFLVQLNKKKKNPQGVANLDKLKMALIFAFEALDIEYLAENITSDCGCTAVVCLVDTVQKLIVCSNIGDSRACIGRLKNAMALTRDQDIQNPVELARIRGSFGGTVDSEGYVNNSVNMTRALGDREAKFHEESGFFSRGFAVVNTPEVKLVHIKDRSHMFLILCCDGLFEPGVFTTTSLTNRARELIEEQKSPTDVSKALCREAIQKGSGDNVSVLTVLFTSGSSGVTDSSSNGGGNNTGGGNGQ